MANILGTLFVNVTANTADFIGGLDKASFAARKAGRDIESSFSRLGDTLGKALAPLGDVGQQIATTLEGIGQAAGKAMASLGSLAAVGVGAGVAAAGLGTALVMAAVHAAALGSQIFEASEKTGLSAEKLSGLMALAKETGGSFDVLTVALGRATANLEKTAEGGGRANAALFQMMGGAQGAAELGLKPMDDRIQIVLKRIFDLTDVGQRNLALTQLLGRGWQQNVETLKLLAEQGYAPAIERAKEFGIYFDADHARQAKEFQTAMADLNGELGAVALTLGSQLIPKLEQWMAEAQVMPEELELLKIGLKAQAASMVDAFGVTDKYLSGLADRATELVTQEDAKIKAYIEHLHQVAAASETAGGKVADFTKPVREHADALERAAKASQDFWEKFNAGITTGEVHIPKVTKTLDELAAAAERDAAAGYTASAAMDAYRNALDKLMHLGTEGAIKAGLPALIAPGAPPPGGLETLMPSPVSMRRIAEGPQTIYDVRQIAQFRDEQRRMNEQWDQAAIQVGNLKTQFTGFFGELEMQGKDLGPKVFGSLLKAIDDVSAQLAKLVVTGHANFKQLLDGLETQVLQAGFEKGIGRLAGAIGGKLGIKVPGAGGQRGDSPGNPMYTSDVNAGSGLGGGFDFSGDSSDGGGDGGGIKGFFKKIGGLFGGGRAVGGPVVPGRAYMVGEHGPEMFMPRQAGAIAPAGLAPGHTTVLNFNVHGVSDYDSFRRSQSQIMAGLQHQLSTAYSRQQG